MDTNHDQLVAALREALGENEPQRPMLIARIPLICNDISNMKRDIGIVRTNQKWIMWMVMGIAAGIGLLALKSLGA